MGNDMRPAAKSETLRERKRRATRATIERAAVLLVAEHGYDNVTVMMICEEAIVSQGTFFNYFPTKDAAIIGIGSIELNFEDIVSAYEHCGDVSLYRATLSLILDAVRDVDWTSEIARTRMRLVSKEPELMCIFLDRSLDFASDFCRALVGYFEAHPEKRTCADALSTEDEARFVVSEALDAAKFALSCTVSRPDEPTLEAEEIEQIVRKIVS